MINDILLNVQKPGRYIGGEPNSIVKDKSKVDVRFAFCFPDTYEVGMSHLGMKIIYSLINSLEWAWCERVFAPWGDMEQQMRDNRIDLYGLESGDSLKEFDIIGFTLLYEMSYTNVLNMLDLAGVPVLARDRHRLNQLVVAGGPCACNPEPMCDFIDLFILGDGEEVTVELLELYRKHKAMGSDKSTFLRAAAEIGGIYVPSLYDVSYNADGTVEAVRPLDGVPATVRKRIVADLDNCFYPDKFVVPFIDVVFDRAVEEIYRGCIRGCRFCQAGYIYRPIREKSAEVANAQAHCLCRNTGYDDLSLLSLSTSDYSQLEPLLDQLLDWTKEEKIGLQMPSLRIDNFSEQLMNKIQAVKRAGLTFAPEAGSQRLRDAINKNISEEDILSTCRMAFEGGYTAVKLYFMMGLPTETMEDIEAIAALAQKIVDLYYSLPSRPKGKSVSVSVSCATFVPKPHTPFQFEAQDTAESINEKQAHLREMIHTRKIQLSLHESPTSRLEAVFARGDRRVGKVIYSAWRKGCRMDSWGEYFDSDKWSAAFDECGLSPEFYANRRRDFDEINPWDHIDYGISKKFLICQDKLAYEGRTTPNCRQQCAGCGAAVYGEGLCVEKR